MAAKKKSRWVTFPWDGKNIPEQEDMFGPRVSGPKIVAIRNHPRIVESLYKLLQRSFYSDSGGDSDSDLIQDLDSYKVFEVHTLRPSKLIYNLSASTGLGGPGPPHVGKRCIGAQRAKACWAQPPDNELMVQRFMAQNHAQNRGGYDPKQFQNQHENRCQNQHENHPESFTLTATNPSASVEDWVVPGEEQRRAGQPRSSQTEPRRGQTGPDVKYKRDGRHIRRLKCCRWVAQTLDSSIPSAHRVGRVL
ncbi:hypothetical protein B0H19DRAFT_1077790 [Mycena capillaripes]|nr:hypothetical protein B0H19DRAFT_1077790 [Mycena capillaripes]